MCKKEKNNSNNEIITNYHHRSYLLNNDIITKIITIRNFYLKMAQKNTHTKDVNKKEQALILIKKKIFFQEYQLSTTVINLLLFNVVRYIYLFVSIL